MGITLLLALPTLAQNTARPGQKVTLEKTRLMDKIRGGWAGKVIGCTYGGPTEFRYRDRMIPDSVTISWPEHRVKWYYDHAPGLYDDVYMDLTFVAVYDRLGLKAPVDSFAMAFAKADYPLWHANQSARYNHLTLKLKPPMSGHWKNNPHADDIDFQIEADYAGLMSPAMINTAVGFTDSIGHIMNHGDGWYGGVFTAAMYALAFACDDPETVVIEALKTIPQGSTFRQCLDDVLLWYAQDKTNWRSTWQKIQNKYGVEKGCPEGVFAPYNIDAKINSAYVAVGLLYGKGDFFTSIDIATRCGQDSDCNPSTVAGVLGVMKGYSGIGRKWTRPVEEVAARNFKYTDISLDKACQMSYRQALQVIRENGGKVTKKGVKIRLQKPQPVRLEQCFEGLEAAKKINLGRKSVANLPPIGFNGCGIAVRGRVSGSNRSYVARLAIYVDGQLEKTMPLPADGHGRSNELYWNYALEDGRHTLKMELLNPENGAKVEAWDAIIYRKAE